MSNLTSLVGGNYPVRPEYTLIYTKCTLIPLSLSAHEDQTFCVWSLTKRSDKKLDGNYTLQRVACSPLESLKHNKHFHLNRE